MVNPANDRIKGMVMHTTRRFKDYRPAPTSRALGTSVQVE